MRWKHWGGLAVGLWLGSLVAVGCDGDEAEPACETDADCTGPQSCFTSSQLEAQPFCTCQAGQNGAGCGSDNDCASGQTCNLDTCVCEGGAGGNGGDGGTAATGGGGAGGGGGGGGANLPPGTTDCQLDIDGCLYSSGNETCSYALSTLLSGTSATVAVRGRLADDPGISDVTVFAFGLDADPSPLGAMCSVTRQGTGAAASLADNFVGKASEMWTIPAGDYVFSMECSFDNTGMGSAQMTVTGDGAPSTPLASTDMGVQNHADVILTVRDATVCGVVLTEP